MTLVRFFVAETIMPITRILLDKAALDTRYGYQMFLSSAWHGFWLNFRPDFGSHRSLVRSKRVELAVNMIPDHSKDSVFRVATPW